MKSDREAYVSLLVIFACMAVVAALINSLSIMSDEYESTNFIQFVLYLSIIIAPDAISQSFYSQPKSGFQRLRQATLALTGTTGLMALLRYPSQELSISEFAAKEAVLILISVIALVVLFFRVRFYFFKKKIAFKILQKGFSIIIFTVICTLFIQHINPLTPAQLTCIFCIILGVISHQFSPGNVKVKAVRKTASRLAKCAIDLFTSISFSSSIVLILSLTLSQDRMSLVELLSMFSFMLIAHLTTISIRKNRRYGSL